MRLSRIRSRVSSSGACRRTSSSKVAFASSIIAHSSPPSVSTPASLNSAGSTWRSSFPSSGRPSESARRLAGSIVSTETFLPRAAIPAAIAAEVVVLPTPPEPAQMHTRLPSSSSATPAISFPRGCGRSFGSPRSPALARLGRQLPDLVDPELGLEDEGNRPHRGADELHEAGELLSLHGGAAALAERREARRAERAIGVAGDGLDPLGLGLREALRVEPVHVHPIDRDTDLLRQGLLERRALVHRHLLG